MSSGGD